MMRNFFKKILILLELTENDSDSKSLQNLRENRRKNHVSFSTTFKDLSEIWNNIRISNK